MAGSVVQQRTEGPFLYLIDFEATARAVTGETVCIPARGSAISVFTNRKTRAEPTPPVPLVRRWRRCELFQNRGFLIDGRIV